MYTNALHVVEVQPRALPAASSSLGKVAALTLGPKCGSLMCRWEWHEQKHRGGRTPRGFGLVRIKRMGRGMVGNKDLKSKLEPDHRNPKCQINKFGL